MRIGVAIGTAVTLAAFGGCGSGGDTGSPGAESSLVGEETAGGTPDSPVSGPDQGSVNLPGLPIGGSVGFEAAGTSTCAFLAWNGGPLPAGVAVRITALHPPPGVGVDPGVACDGPACSSAVSFTAAQQTCTVGLRWDGTPVPDQEAVIGAAGSATCASQVVCDVVRADADASDGVAFVDLPELTEAPTSEDPTDESD